MDVRYFLPKKNFDFMSEGKMLRHVVMVNFKAEVGQRERDEFTKKATETLAQVPGTKNIIMGQASEVQCKARYSVALFIDFENEAAMKKYFEHPGHKAVAAQMPSLLSESLVSNYLY
jgi:quinol monooxygenase YgiN